MKRHGGMTLKVTAEGMAKLTPKTKRLLVKVIGLVFRETSARQEIVVTPKVKKAVLRGKVL